MAVDYQGIEADKYDHSTGEGGTFADADPELEAEHFECFDIVAFDFKVAGDGLNSGTNATTHVDLFFDHEATNGAHLGFDHGVGYHLDTTDPAYVDTGAAASLSPASAAGFTDNGSDPNGSGAVTLSLDISGVNSGDVIIVRIKVRLGNCGPTDKNGGNVLTGVADVTATDQTGGDIGTSGAGQQTVPMKFSSDLATIKVKKVLVPSTDSGKFNLQIDGITAATNVGNGGSTGAQTALAGDHTVGETAGTGTNLGNYGTTVSCTNGTQTSNFSGPGPHTISPAPSEHWECTITNTRGTPNLTIAKEAQNVDGQPITTIPLGGSFNYVITVTNTGNASASPVFVTDNLNDSLTVNSATWDVNPPDSSTDGTCTVGAGNAVSCPSSGTITLAASDGSANGNDTLQVVISVTVPENLTSCPTLTNSAQVRIGIEGTPSQAQSAPVDVTGCAPGLTITKEGPATVGQGGAITYTVTVHNSGNAAATGVVVTDNLNDSLKNVAGSFDGGESSCNVGDNPSNSNDHNYVTCYLGTVSGGDTVVITITANAPVGQCPTITNQASFVTQGGEGPGGSSNLVTTTVTGCAPPSGPSAGIQVVKGGPAQAHVGDTITYTFAVSLAAGSASLTNITISDPICSATPTLVSKTGGNQDTTLETGETWNYSCTHVVTATDPDPLPNTVTVTGGGPNGQVSDTDTHSVDIIHPAIRIVKTAKPDSVGPGETVTYTYTVTNTGDVALFNVKVTDNKLGNICTIAQLDVGETQTCTADFTASSDFGGPVDNVGKAKGHDVTGFSVEDTDKASIDVVLGTTVTPVTPPSGVAFTGASGVITMTGVALLLLLLGTGILFFTRRREDGTES